MYKHTEQINKQNEWSLEKMSLLATLFFKYESDILMYNHLLPLDNCYLEQERKENMMKSES